ncbi:hypothetical protein SUGI_0614790 [Cryptomeria japonica]|uniref:filament-like plant protein n=1 Tax=Cryptomeria japonica TaxID=3369 RepID=UPI0024149346|nr:filament-like plant protein [Cryptomeria japonica]GLJ30899.1 hypothetical protein SUGI_0614790 [Cryptomeria japonica]
MESPKSSSSSSWPWRKKSSQTHTHVATASPKQGTDTATASGNERGSQSLSENMVNKNLVQQHAQIAEEAVSGRQKAESDGARYKKQVEEALEQKADAEDRLHKCMKEREEEAIMRRKEWDKLRMAAEQQLVAAEAENSVILTSLQERDATLALLTKGKDKAEAQLQSLYVKMTSLLKENSRLKYELHLLNKEQQIRTDDKYTRLEQLRHVTPTKNLTMPASTHPKSSSATRKYDPQLGRISAHDLCKAQKQGIDEVHSNKEKVFETLESDLQVLRSVGCDVEANSGDADEVTCAQSLASAMIAELDHFRRDKALMLFDHKSIDLDFPNIAIEDHLTEIESVASCSDPNKTYDRRSLKQEIEIQAADRKNWRSQYARDMSDSSMIVSKYCMSITEIVKLVKALAHPLLYSTTKSFSDNKFVQSSSELSESDLQLNIEKLEVMKEKAAELGGRSVSWAAVDFLQVLVGVLNRLVKIALYRNAQRDGCSDECDDDDDDDMSGLASVSQKINTASASFNNFLSPPSKLDFNRESTPAIRHDKLPTKIGESENEQVKSWESPFPLVDKDASLEGVGVGVGVVYTPKLVGGAGHGHPSLNSKHLITPTNNSSSSSSSKLFHFNSNYIKTAIRSTISKTRTQSSVSSTTAPSYPHVKSKPPNKLLNRLLSFS